MWLNERKRALCLGLALVLGMPALCRASGDVDQARLNAADSEPQNWFTLGRDGNQTYFSPLSTINDGNIDRLGFAWSYDLGTIARARRRPQSLSTVSCTHQAPGVSRTRSTRRPARRCGNSIPKRIRALRATHAAISSTGVFRFGRVRFRHLGGRRSPRPRCQDRKAAMETPTITDHTVSYSSTGAVYIAGNVAVIGNSGSDMDHGAVRGYVSAFDVDTGALKWRVYTVLARREHPLKVRSWQRRKGLGLPCVTPCTRAAGRFGTASPTIQRSIWCISGRQMRRPMICANSDLAWRRPIHGFDHRGQRRYRPNGLVLSDDPGRPLGLRFGSEADPRRPQCRRASTGSSCKRTRTAFSTCSIVRLES